MRAQFGKLRSNKKVMQNTLILCTVWTSSAYTFFFCEFYLRFVPTNTIYAQKIYVGLADFCSTLLVYYMAKRQGFIKVIMWLFGLLIVSSISLVITLATSSASDPDADLSPGLAALLTCSIIGMRIASFASYVCYVQLVLLTPTLLTGIVFACCGTVSRSLAILAPISAELMGNPAWTCAVLAFAGILALPHLHFDTKTME